VLVKHAVFIVNDIQAYMYAMSGLCVQAFVTNPVIQKLLEAIVPGGCAWVCL
jgi:hypothetical protein